MNTEKKVVMKTDPELSRLFLPLRLQHLDMSDGSVARIIFDAGRMYEKNEGDKNRPALTLACNFRFESANSMTKETLAKYLVAMAEEVKGAVIK